MKHTLISAVLFASLPQVVLAKEKEAPAVEKAASYQDEAPLPKGWPQPGPFGEVSEKEYPVYRAAYAGGNGERGSFFTLFKHIQSKDIPMTAPVEMEMQEKDGELEMTTMGFLYQDTEVGELGKDGDKVLVTDVAKMTVLSYAWMGADSKEAQAKAKAALDGALEKQGKTAKGFRMLGYNGPGTPKAKRTYEMQAVLDE